MGLKCHPKVSKDDKESAINSRRKRNILWLMDQAQKLEGQARDEAILRIYDRYPDSFTKLFHKELAEAGVRVSFRKPMALPSMTDPLPPDSESEPESEL